MPRYRDRAASDFIFERASELIYQGKLDDEVLDRLAVVSAREDDILKPLYIIRLKKIKPFEYMDKIINLKVLGTPLEGLVEYEHISILGCPYCYHVWEPKEIDPRICPICKKHVKAEHKEIFLLHKKVYLNKYGEHCDKCSWNARLENKFVNAPFFLWGVNDPYSHRLWSNYCFEHLLEWYETEIAKTNNNWLIDGDDVCFIREILPMYREAEARTSAKIRNDNYSSSSDSKVKGAYRKQLRGE
ncbi:hypothetical protein KA005_25105 [bacterium]|nr:hypothetical protein [bacterium]